MGLFKSSDPAQTLQREITATKSDRDKSKANRNRLAKELREWEATIVEREAKASALKRDGADDNVLDAAEAGIGAAEKRAKTIRGSLADEERDLAALEQTLAEKIDRKQREETSAEIELLAREIIEVAKVMDAASAKLADCTARAIPAVYEASGLHNLAMICRTELPVASDLIGRLLRVYSAAVIAGTAPAVLGKPPEAFVEPTAPAKPPTQTLFSLRDIKWTNDQGERILCGQYVDAELPVRLVAPALASGALVPVDDQLRKQNYNARGGRHPIAARCFDLDILESEPVRTVEPIQHSAFEKPVIGEARIIKIAAR